MQKHLIGEEEALAALLRGLEEGLDYFFRRYHAPLTYFAQGLIHDRETAEDLVEDAFLKLWERREALGVQGSLRSWLYTTVRNSCIDIMRKEKRKVLYLADAKATGETEDRPVLHRIIEAETMHQVYAALQTLPPKCEQVFPDVLPGRKKLTGDCHRAGTIAFYGEKSKRKSHRVIKKKAASHKQYNNSAYITVAQYKQFQK